MARKAGKEYQPDDIRTATFKLAHHKWEAFQAICNGQDRSASDALLEFVETILNGGDIPGGGNVEMGKFREELDAIKARLDALEFTNGAVLEPLPADNSEGWSAAQLERRLGVGGNWVNTRRNKPDFGELCRAIDPDGLAWESRKITTANGKKKIGLFPVKPAP
jgi:hypothetical protein